jgi:hypothetical protein
MAKPPAPIETIRLRLGSLAEAFERLDPAPLDQRRLAPEVMTYILGRAEEVAPERPFAIVVHLPDDEFGPRRAQLLADAIHSCFHQQSDWERDERHEIFRTGRQFLVIGLFVYVGIWLGLALLQRVAMHPVLFTFAQDSSVILAWVIIWRPAEIFLYDWLPIHKRRRLFDRIAAAPVSVAPPPDGV